MNYKETPQYKLERFLNPACDADFELIKTVEQIKLATEGRKIFNLLINSETTKAIVNEQANLTATASISA